MLNVHCAVAAPLILLVIPVRVKMLSEEVQAIDTSVEVGRQEKHGPCTEMTCIRCNCVWVMLDILFVAILPYERATESQNPLKEHSHQNKLTCRRTAQQKLVEFMQMYSQVHL